MSKTRQLGRTLFSSLPKLGLIRKPLFHRPRGTSAMMTVKNEEDWIERSILSLVREVDEVVVVEGGSEDRTYNLVCELRSRFPEKIRIFRVIDADFCTSRNIALHATRFSTVLRWDGDFIARTTGSNSVSHLLSRVSDLDRLRYYCVWLGPVSLDGDVFHQIPEDTVEREPVVFTYHPILHYRQIGRFETLQVPFFFKRLDWTELYYFHMRYVKPARRILFRFFWTEWMALPDKTEFPTLDSFVKRRIRGEYGTEDLNEATRRRFLDLSQELVPYDRARYGEYPAIIKDELQHPKYRLIFEDGRIVGRSDINVPSPTSNVTTPRPPGSEECHVSDLEGKTP